MTSPINRRELLRTSALVGTGVVLGNGLPALWQSLSVAWAADTVESTPEQRLRALKLELPQPTAPIATFVPVVRVGNMLYVSGHGPRNADGSRIIGKVGADMTLEEANAAARNVGLVLLGAVRASLGSLDSVVRLVKTLGMVNAAPDFTQHPQVINGFSDLMVEVFGPVHGKGTRSAVGMSSLPGGIPVEVEAIFQIRT